MKTFIFSGDGRFYKGNLHCHSTLSDGRKTPEQLVEDYRAQGYSFLSISDHDVFFSHDGLCSDDFLTLPTVEYASDLRDHHYEEEYWVKTHHTLGIMDYSGEAKCERPLQEGEVLIHPRFFGENTAQSMRKTLESRGAFCVYNHPSWSKTDRADYGLLQGFAALEIYNFSGEVDNGTGGSFVQWDALLDAGAHINGVATDDNHNQGIPDDSYGGFVQVWSDDFSRRGICAALRAGCYYSSSGASISQIAVEERMVTVHCEPAQRIRFVSGPCVCGGHCVYPQGEPLTTASYTVAPQDTYCRVEVISPSGCAWSNPIWFD